MSSISSRQTLLCFYQLMTWVDSSCFYQLDNLSNSCTERRNRCYRTCFLEPLFCCSEPFHAHFTYTKFHQLHRHVELPDVDGMKSLMRRADVEDVSTKTCQMIKRAERSRLSHREYAQCSVSYSLLQWTMPTPITSFMKTCCTMIAIQSYIFSRKRLAARLLSSWKSFLLKYAFGLLGRHTCTWRRKLAGP